jgi:hypothetical protein
VRLYEHAGRTDFFSEMNEIGYVVTDGPRAYWDEFGAAPASEYVAMSIECKTPGTTWHDVR